MSPFKNFYSRESKECCMYPFLEASTLKDSRESGNLGKKPRIRDDRLKDRSENWLRVSEQNRGKDLKLVEL